jgi:hypothetical protein
MPSWLTLVAFLTVSLLCPQRSLALTGIGSTPQRMKQDAGYVFAGTVLRSVAQKVRGRILTRVTFGDLRFAKGGPADTLCLTLEGGTVGDELVVVDGQPTFLGGVRYIVFASADLGSPSPWYLPVVGMGYGRFQVVSDSLTGRQQILNAGGMPVVAVSERRFTVVQLDSMVPARYLERQRTIVRHDPAYFAKMREEGAVPTLQLMEEEDPGTRITEEEFLAVVRTFTDEPARKSSAPADTGGLLKRAWEPDAPVDSGGLPRTR